MVCYAIFKALYADGKDLRDTEDDLVRVKAAKPIGEALIAAHEQGPWLGLIGERRINVLELNLALDQLR